MCESEHDKVTYVPFNQLRAFSLPAGGIGWSSDLQGGSGKGEPKSGNEESSRDHIASEWYCYNER